mgnify:CR=1 FL=1
MNRKQLNTADRKATLQEFGVLLNKELPWVPLYAADIAKAYRFRDCGTGLPENIRCDGSKAVKSRAVQSVFFTAGETELGDGMSVGYGYRLVITQNEGNA